MIDKVAKFNSVMSNALRVRVGNISLTPQQYRVLELLLLGATTKDIEVSLGVSSSTAKFHRSAIYRKFSAASHHDLLRKFGSFEATIKWVPCE